MNSIMNNKLFLEPICDTQDHIFIKKKNIIIVKNVIKYLQIINVKIVIINYANDVIQMKLFNRIK